MRAATSSGATPTRTSWRSRSSCLPSFASCFELLPPARVLRRPAEPLAGARVRGAALLGHAVDRHPVAAREALVDRDAGWLGGAERARGERQPLAHLDRVVIDD